MAKNFESSNHALFAGQILGLLMKTQAEGSIKGLTNVRPTVDDDGDYTRELRCLVDGRGYTIAIHEDYGSQVQRNGPD